MTDGGISSALAREVDRLELLVARSWQGLGALLLIGTTVVGLALDPALGRPGALVSALMVTWGTLLARAVQKQGRGRSRAWAVLSAIFESLVPFLLIALLVVSVGPVRTFEQAMFGPLLMVGAASSISLVRMDWRLTLLGASVGVVAYGLIAFVVVPMVGTAEDLANINFSLDRSLVRMCILFIGGIGGSFIAFGLRRAVRGTVRRVREQELFGKYRLEHEIAKGGMGSVWRATYCPEGGFSRPAAIKRIHEHLARDEAFVGAFRREAELGARLVHHNIVQTLDFGSVRDEERDATTFFMAMELVDGCSVADLMKRARLRGMRIPPRVVALIAQDVLAGLAYAHESARGDDGAPLRVVHRDIAPQNVLVSTAGLVKLTDFGIARALGDHTAALTAAMGHKGHVAPEHADGKPIDARSDLFQVGVLVWELLCGRHLFVREQDVATLRALLLEPAPAPSSVDGALAPWDAFVAHALEKEPALRWTSATEMAAGLADIVAHAGIASADELGSLVRALGAADLHDAETARIGASSPAGSDVTARTPARPGAAR